MVGRPLVSRSNKFESDENGEENNTLEKVPELSLRVESGFATPNRVASTVQQEVQIDNVTARLQKLIKPKGVTSTTATTSMLKRYAGGVAITTFGTKSPPSMLLDCAKSIETLQNSYGLKVPQMKRRLKPKKANNAALTQKKKLACEFDMLDSKR